MKIAQVNNCDLMGRRFNGHDLQLSLNRLGHEGYQFVLEKYGTEDTTIKLVSTNELFIRSILRNLENQLSINDLIFPFGKKLSEHPIYQKADIVHFHLIHNYFLSVLDLPKLANSKPTVWTVHDPWAVTGHCVYPLDCTGWKNGCNSCPKLDDIAFPMKVDNASQMWEIKRRIYKEIDIDIVVASNFMESYIKNSPLTAHFKNVHKIPFGVNIDGFQNSKKSKARSRWGIPDSTFVITFRSESSEVKGLKYIIEALNKLTPNMPVTLLTVGIEPLPMNLSGKYRIIELGWIGDNETLYDFYAASDVFLMPSLVESFGLMAIEAMASGCPIIVFENTVLAEITFAPECGIAVPYKNSDKLKKAVEDLMFNPDERLYRGKKGKKLAEMHYRYEDYVNRHISLYQDILARS